MTNHQKKEKWLEIHKKVMLKFWDNLPWTARNVIAADTENVSKSLEYFSKYVNRETDRQFRSQFDL